MAGNFTYDEDQAIAYYSRTIITELDESVSEGNETNDLSGLLIKLSEKLASAKQTKEELNNEADTNKIIYITDENGKKYMLSQAGMIRMCDTEIRLREENMKKIFKKEIQKQSNLEKITKIASFGDEFIGTFIESQVLKGKVNLDVMNFLIKSFKELVPGPSTMITNLISGIREAPAPKSYTPASEGKEKVSSLRHKFGEPEEPKKPDVKQLAQPIAPVETQQKNVDSPLPAEPANTTNEPAKPESPARTSLSARKSSAPETPVPAQQNVSPQAPTQQAPKQTSPIRESRTDSRDTKEPIESRPRGKFAEVQQGPAIITPLATKTANTQGKMNESIMKNSEKVQKDKKKYVNKIDHLINDILELKGRIDKAGFFENKEKFKGDIVRNLGNLSALIKGLSQQGISELQATELLKESKEPKNFDKFVKAYPGFEKYGGTQIELDLFQNVADAVKDKQERRPSNRDN